MDHSFRIYRLLFAILHRKKVTASIQKLVQSALFPHTSSARERVKTSFECIERHTSNHSNRRGLNRLDQRSRRGVGLAGTLNLADVRAKA